MALEPGFKVWMGPGRHLVHYPVSGGREVNVVGIVPAGDWRTESWISEGTVDGLRGAYAGWAPQVQALLARAPSAYLYALYDREPLPRIVRGRVALLGDAAHPMLPFLAQGAAQAFEDGAALALCLREGGAADGVARYERVRLDRVSDVQRRSRGRPEIYHLPDGPEQRRRDAELAAEDRLGHASWLYAHDAEAAVRGPGIAAPG
jgi:salicylate hydroxylase